MDMIAEIERLQTLLRQRQDEITALRERVTELSLRQHVVDRYEWSAEANDYVPV